MATIIKRESAHRNENGHAVRGVAFDFEDLAGHADDYVESVRREAAKIVQQAHAEAQGVRDRSEKAGREAAEAAIEQLLNEKVASQMATIRPALDQVVEQLLDARGSWLDYWDRSVVNLAANMAERIIRRELAERPETTLSWIREALELASGSAEVTLKLHPEDHANLGEQAATLAGQINKLAKTSIVTDESISRGGCVVETQYGVIDQQVETQLNRLVEDLT